MNYLKQKQLLDEIVQLINQKKTFQLNRFTNPEKFEKIYIKNLKKKLKPLKHYLKS